MKLYLQKYIIITLIAADAFFSVSCSNTVKAKETAHSVPTSTVETQISSISETRIETTQSGTETSQSETDARIDDFSSKLYKFLSDSENGESVGDTAFKLNYSEWHNACVYVVSEALRNVGCDIPVSVNRTENLAEELEDRGFELSYDLSALQPGDICFTTDEEGNIGGRPTHAYVFLGWESAGVANIFDNQVYDYGSLYHTRNIGLTFFNDQKDSPKEATAFFMRK